MNTLSPKTQFLKVHKEDAERLMTIVTSERTLSVACLYAHSQVAYNGATKEQMDGARLFITELLNLGDEKAATAPLPAHHLVDVEAELRKIQASKSKPTETK